MKTFSGILPHWNVSDHLCIAAKATRILTKYSNTATPSGVAFSMRHASMTHGQGFLRIARRFRTLTGISSRKGHPILTDIKE